jgi:hypothetical protein
MPFPRHIFLLDFKPIEYNKRVKSPYLNFLLPNLADDISLNSVK